MFFIGHLGPAAITAVGLSETIIFLPAIALAGLGVGVTAIVARHAGAGEFEQANITVRQAMLMVFILGIVFAIILWFSADQLLWIFRARLMYCSAAILRALGDTKTPMIIMIIVEVIGVSLAYVLINGLGAMPALGVFGAGIGRAVASTVGALIILPILIKGKDTVKYDLRTAFDFDWTETKRILNVGLPAFGDQLAMQGAMNIYTIILSSLGTTVYAAHALAMRIENFAFMPSFGFGIAAAISVGQYLGAKKPDLAKRAGYLAQRYCLAAMVCLGLITFIFARQLIGLFTDDPEVMRIGALGLRIWALAMPGMATNQTFAGGLRGAGDTRWVFILNAMGMWIMRVGGGASMVFLFHLGAPGAWIGAVLDHNVRAILMWRRFAGGKWQSIKV